MNKNFSSTDQRSAGLTLSQMTDFGLFQTEKFADDNFKFDENGRKFSRSVENTVGKGEITCYKQFLKTFITDM